MRTVIDDEGHTREYYDSKGEYRARKYQLDRTMGRRQYIYEGWLDGKLVRIFRR